MVLAEFYVRKDGMCNCWRFRIIAEETNSWLIVKDNSVLKKLDI
ncbi:6833_t:CDS:1, partial [Gigaspora rosea]